MNRLIHNPNVRRIGLPLAVTAALLGGAACTSENNPTPTPSSTTADAASTTLSCAVSVEAHGLIATIKLDAKNEYAPGVYDVEEVEYDYGDGQSGTADSHAYAKAGSYIRASMVMDVAPGAEAEAPFPDGFAAPCSPATATIG